MKHPVWVFSTNEKESNFRISYREFPVCIIVIFFSFQVDHQFIYWTDLQLRGVYRADKHTGGNLKEIIKRLDDSPRGIQVYANERQNCTENVCKINNGGCADACFPGPDRTALCKCTGGKTSLNNGTQCIDPNKASR